MTRFYLVLTFLGVFLPYGAFIPWLLSNGFDIPLLLKEAMVNPISLFAWLDVLVSAVALLGFIMVDGKRNKVKYWYLAALGTVSVGVSCGLPMYLYFKEKQLLESSLKKDIGAL